MALLFPALSGHAQTGAGPEYQLKAWVLVNLARFVEWPTNTWDGPDTPFVLGIVGEDPFGAALEQTTQGQAVHGRRLVVRRFASGEDARRCHLLFVSPAERRQWATLFSGLQGARVLTVSEASRFAHEGGMVNLVRREERVRFEVNLRSVERHGLRISSKLLKHATLVSPPDVSPPR